MGNRCCKSNVAHPLSADCRAGHFNPTLLAGDTLETDVFILTAVALPVLGGAKDGFAEETVFLRP